MILKIISLGIISCFLNIVIRRFQKELALPIELVYLCTVIILLISVSSDIYGLLSGYFSEFESGERMFTDIFRASGICILTKFSSDICSEGGSKLISDVIDFSGRVMLIVIILPYIKNIIGVAVAFAK